MTKYVKYIFWVLAILVGLVIYNFIQVIFEFEKKWLSIFAAIISFIIAREVVKDFVLPWVLKTINNFKRSNPNTKKEPIHTKEKDKQFEDSIDILLNLGEVPIDQSIIELSESLTKSIERNFSEIDNSNRFFVLWELSMFFTILAYTCRSSELNDKDQENMYESFGVMAKVIPTCDETSKMNGKTDREIFGLYIDRINERLNDYQGGNPQGSCVKLFQNIAKVCEINDATFWMMGSTSVYGETLQFIGYVNDLDSDYSYYEGQYN